ncbi:transferases, transferring hexosyl groups [Prunus dulcis]|uniref:GPI mannosyltransferase 2 n=1 Tax=Prunus dulcis TaxID=3755 RepID=A0A4Y1RJA2_PRUDU|nr:transferases, transferring hexosyl groups [Prunus dulcis]
MVLAPLVPVIGQRAVLGLSGFVINNIAFVIVADHDAALRASILFCFNPASIFYSSIYSETLYALFSVGGLYHLISGKDVIAVLWFALSGFSRSNGIINAGCCWWSSALGVGFLRYFQVKQLPNFLLASPILSLALCSIVHYAKLKPEIFFSLGFCAPPEHKDSAAVFFSFAENSSNSRGITSKRHLKLQSQSKEASDQDGTSLLPEEYKLSAKQGYLSAAVLPCILHLGFMAATAFFVMHVQVSFLDINLERSVTKFVVAAEFPFLLSPL